MAKIYKFDDITDAPRGTVFKFQTGASSVRFVSLGYQGVLYCDNGVSPPHWSTVRKGEFSDDRYVLTGETLTFLPPPKPREYTWDEVRGEVAGGVFRVLGETTGKPMSGCFFTPSAGEVLYVSEDHKQVSQATTHLWNNKKFIKTDETFTWEVK